MAAIKSGDQNSLVAIFGPDSKQIISSGDAVEDKNDATTFATGYETMHRWRKIADGAQILLIGADNFPFAVPLKKNADGQWFFDTAAGKDEFLSRRIGRNELAIIDACRAGDGRSASVLLGSARWRDDETICDEVHQRPWEAQRFVLGVAAR